VLKRKRPRVQGQKPLRRVQLRREILILEMKSQFRIEIQQQNMEQSEGFKQKRRIVKTQVAL
jgi:hypothetical protein